MQSVLKTMDEAKHEKRTLVMMILTYQRGRKYSKEELEKKPLKRLREIYDAEVKHPK